RLRRSGPKGPRVAMEDSMHKSSPRRFPLTALAAGVALAALAVTSCSNSSARPAGAGTTGPTRPTSGRATTPAGTTSPASPSTCPGGWRRGTTTLTRQVQVPPVPVATAIRTGSHPDCRFDRLVVDISGPLPGYTVGFVAKVIQDASGKTITMPG